jgi:hypothetical protein
MKGERGVWTFGPIAGLVIVILAVVGAFAICTDEDEEIDGLGRVEQLADHDWGGECWDEYDCYGRGGDGGYSGGHQGYGGGGGRSGDYDGGPGDDCRNLCGNTIIVPTPEGGSREG